MNISIQQTLDVLSQYENVLDKIDNQLDNSEKETGKSLQRWIKRWFLTHDTERTSHRRKNRDTGLHQNYILLCFRGKPSGK